MGRLPLASLLVIAAVFVALAGCGGGDDADSPLDNALGYLPADAPLVLMLSTDLEGDQFEAADEMVERFPLGDQLIEGLTNELESGSVDFDDDIRPLLGNDAVLGVPGPRELLADDVGFVAALQTTDGDKLEDLISEDAEEIGDEGDATLYRSEDDDVVAIDGDVVIVASTEDSLRDAIERREEDDRLREDDVEGSFEDLPEDAAARVYGNVEALLEADESTAAARRADWIDALTTFGATGSIEEGSIAIDFRVNTEGDLSEEDLPIAAGAEAPPVIGRGAEIGGGIRNPAQIVRFAETVGQAISPEGFAEYQQAKQQIAQGLNVDIDEDLIGQFTGDLSVAVDLGGNFAVRAELENPREFEQTLERLVRVIPSFAEGAGLGDVGVSRPRGDEDFYAVAGADGEGVVYGVVDDVFVLANDAERAGDLASEQPQEVEGAQGAFVVRADAEEVAGALLSQLGGFFQLGTEFTAPLGDLVGSLRADEDGLRGQLQLEIDR
jgi:hypothetical protein